MKYTEFVLLVAKMRTAQIKYFADRGRSDLADAKRLEAEVDHQVGQAIAELAAIDTAQQLRMAFGEEREEP